MKNLVIITLFLVLTTNITAQTNSFVDQRDKRVYKTVLIGNQNWMAENLAFKADSGCMAYNNEDSNVVKYGYLYNFNTSKNICPVGWHLPSDSDWKQLETTLGMTQTDVKKEGWRGEGIGSKLKSSTGWTYNVADDNLSGFNALPGGFRNYDNTFDYIEDYCYFWTSTAYDKEYAWNRAVIRDFGGVNRALYLRTRLFSVRCLKDK